MLLRKPISNVNLFSGKDSQFRANIIYFLGTNTHVTTWDIARYISRNEIRLEPSRKSQIIKSHSAGVYRNIKERMLPEGFVEKSISKISKGNEIPTYRLTLKGSLSVLALNLNEGEIRSVVDTCSQVNPFFSLILKLENNGIKKELIRQSLLDGLVNGVQNRAINLITENESIIGASIIPALMLHLSEIKKRDLMLFMQQLEQLLMQKYPDKLSQFVNLLYGTMINPLLWKMWKDNEDSQIITLHSLIQITLNPNYDLEFKKIVETKIKKTDQEKALEEALKKVS